MELNMLTVALQTATTPSQQSMTGRTIAVRRYGRRALGVVVAGAVIALGVAAIVFVRVGLYAKFRADLPMFREIARLWG
jgi:hypothetical protein